MWKFIFLNLISFNLILKKGNRVIELLCNCPNNYLDNGTEICLPCDPYCLGCTITVNNCISCVENRISSICTCPHGYYDIHENACPSNKFWAILNK